MSKTIKFTVSDERYQELIKRATEERLSIQDYIRKELFMEENVLTVFDAVNKALNKYTKGEKFSVPDIYGEKWSLPNGQAGQFGRRFFELVEAEYSNQIIFTGTYNARGQALYERA